MRSSTLCVLVAVAAATLPGTAAAATARIPCTPPGPHTTDTTSLTLVSAGGSPCTVLRLIAGLNLGSEAQGHFHVFGPNGEIATSADKFWSSGEQYRVEVGQVTGGSHLWCVDFWTPANSKHGETNCVGF
ncbi:hypothetical protein [Amycolatopsis sp. MEPSY49]|uniref:hypothetical protein n=1 Tax=Amycolatopsis sp. MEPSY49 TaxID=3151600 RepID=UPI003EF94772